MVDVQSRSVRRQDHVVIREQQRVVDVHRPPVSELDGERLGRHRGAGLHDVDGGQVHRRVDLEIALDHDAVSSDRDQVVRAGRHAEREAPR